MNEKRPVLYSFRRCPYAMRARMGLVAGNQNVWLREIVLRDKPDEMLSISPKGTVPVLEVSPGSVIEESLEIMHWALGRNDPRNLLARPGDEADQSDRLIQACDGDFKFHLDRYKYSTRYDGAVREEHRGQALDFLEALNTRLTQTDYLLGDRVKICDLAIFPFVRQFANTDSSWFDGLALPGLQRWLAQNLTSDLFAQIMQKYPTWKTSGNEFDLLTGHIRQVQPAG